MIRSFGAGRLGQDPEVSYSSNNKTIAKFSVACRNGNEPEWIRLVCFDKLAETCAKYLSKGSLVSFCSKPETKKYEDRTTGETKYYTSNIIKDITFLSSSKPKPDPVSNDPNSPNSDAPDLPF